MIMTTIGPTLDITEAAAMMKIHPKSVLEKINSGALAAGKIGKKHVMLTKDVLALIEHEIITQTAARMGTPTRYQRRSAKSLPRKLA